MITRITMCSKVAGFLWLMIVLLYLSESTTDYAVVSNPKHNKMLTCTIFTNRIISYTWIIFLLHIARKASIIMCSITCICHFLSVSSSFVVHLSHLDIFNDRNTVNMFYTFYFLRIWSREGKHKQNDTCYKKCWVTCTLIRSFVKLFYLPVLHHIMSHKKWKT